LNSNHLLSQTVQDFKIIFLIHSDTTCKTFLWISLQDSKKKTDVHFLGFDLLIRVFLVFETVKCGTSNSAYWSRGRIRETNFRHLLWPNKIWFNLEPFKQLRRHSVSTHFWSPLIFSTVFAHNFVMFKCCVQIWRTVHSLILSSFAIIRIVNRRYWRKNDLITVCVCVILTDRGVQVAVQLPMFLVHL
jgi:hypothetical protein